MTLNFDHAVDDAYYQAALSRDARFDGCFFTCVATTKIYCRPVCRVKAPKRENCSFVAHAAQAEAAGYRPCLRCRPELAPHSLIWSIQDASHTLALQAARLWDDAGPLLMPSVAQVAAKLGVSDRHLRRIFQMHLGVSPVQYLQTRRLLCAKQLLTDTRLPMVDVAMASGFGSLRRFNTAFVQHYRLAPTRLRREGAPSAVQTQLAHTGSTRVQLAYRPPYDVDAMLSFLTKRQIRGVEHAAVIDGNTHVTRTASFNVGARSVSGWLQWYFDPVRSVVQLQVSDSLCSALPMVIARMRAALDLDADPQAINAVLGPHFPGNEGKEGIRVPGCIDGFEVAVRAIVGQQVTVAAGRTFTQRLVDTFGQPVATTATPARPTTPPTPAKTATPHPQLNRLFPTPAALASAAPEALGALGLVKQRQAALIALSQAVASGSLELNTPARALQTIDQLKALPGIGDWTAQYIAMRALRWPDAFPAGDVALHNALGLRAEKQPARAAEAASQVWRPWRSYAVLRAWHSLEKAL